MAWSITAARRPSVGRCRWRAAPTAPRAFPGPRSPCGPCPARPRAVRPDGAAARFPAPPDRPVPYPTAYPAPGARPGHAACATRRSARYTAPRGAATRPYRPCPGARTRPGSPPCSEPNSFLVEAAQGPRDQVVADCPSHQHARPAPSTDPWWWPRKGLLPRPQLNDSVLPPASPEADTEGGRPSRASTYIYIYAKNVETAEWAGDQLCR